MIASISAGVVFSLQVLPYAIDEYLHGFWLFPSAGTPGIALLLDQDFYTCQVIGIWTPHTNMAKV